MGEKKGGWKEGWVRRRVGGKRVGGKRVGGKRGGWKEGLGGRRVGEKVPEEWKKWGRDGNV